MTTNAIERLWIEALAKRGPPMSELGPAVVEQVLQLLDAASNQNPNLLAEVLDNEDHEAQSLDQIQKRAFYNAKLDEIWAALVYPLEDAELSVDEYNRWVEAGYSCLPWLVQELEGTLRRFLRLVLYLRAVGTGKTLTWKQHERRVRFLPEAMEAVAKAFDAGEPMHLLIQPLQQGDRVRLLRNACAHNDWALFHWGEPIPRVAFFDQGRPKVFTMPLDHVLRFFGLILEVNLVLAAALHLVYSRLRGENPHDPGPHAKALSGDPRFWTGTLFPGPRRVATNAATLAASLLSFHGTSLDAEARNRMNSVKEHLEAAMRGNDDELLMKAIGSIGSELRRHSAAILLMASEVPFPPSVSAENDPKDAG